MLTFPGRLYIVKPEFVIPLRPVSLRGFLAHCLAVGIFAELIHLVRLHMKFTHGIFFLLFCVFVSVSTASGAGLEEIVQEHTLKNGMKLLLVERHTSPTVAAWIRFKVGSVNERSDERGIAHLLEHMLFKGTKTLGTKDFAKEKPLLDSIEKTAQLLMAEKLKREAADPKKIEELSKKLAALEAAAGKYVVKNEVSRIYDKNGGNNYNAFTGKDSTAYMVSLPANKLELWAATRVGPLAQCRAAGVLYRAERGDGGATSFL